jgi:hypothetical protein
MLYPFPACVLFSDYQLKVIINLAVNYKVKALALNFFSNLKVNSQGDGKGIDPFNRASEILRITRQTLQNKLKEYGLT